MRSSGRAGRFSLFLFLILTAGPIHAANTFPVDLKSSTVRFKVIHMGLPFVRGRFEKFDGTIQIEDGRLTGFEGNVDMPSLKTGINARDRDLKSADFFAVEKYPKMTIKSRQVRQEGEKIIIQSYLTIKDITEPVELRGTVSSTQDGTTMLNLNGIINRMDYGLKLPDFFEFFIGNNVNIYLRLKAKTS